MCCIFWHPVVVLELDERVVYTLVVEILMFSQPTEDSGKNGLSDWGVVSLVNPRALDGVPIGCSIHSAAAVDPISLVGYLVTRCELTTW